MFPKNTWKIEKNFSFNSKINNTGQSFPTCVSWKVQFEILKLSNLQTIQQLFEHWTFLISHKLRSTDFKHGFSSPSLMIDTLFHPQHHQKKMRKKTLSIFHIHVFQHVLSWHGYVFATLFIYAAVKKKRWRILVGCEKQTQNKELKQVLGHEAANMNFFWVLNMFSYSIVIFFLFLFYVERKRLSYPLKSARLVGKLLECSLWDWKCRSFSMFEEKFESKKLGFKPKLSYWEGVYVAELTLT